MKTCFRGLHNWECHFSKGSPKATTTVPAAGQGYRFPFHEWSHGTKVNDRTFCQPSLLLTPPSPQASEQRLASTGYPTLLFKAWAEKLLGSLPLVPIALGDIHTVRTGIIQEDFSLPEGL